MGHYYASTMGPSETQTAMVARKRRAALLDYEAHPSHHGPSQCTIRPRAFDACSRQGHYRQTHPLYSQTQPGCPRTLARTQCPYGETQHHSRHYHHHKNPQEDYQLLPTEEATGTTWGIPPWQDRPGEAWTGLHNIIHTPNPVLRLNERSC